jgi:hypothetical protein
MINRRYYWTKTKSDFWNTPEAKALLSETNGSDYIVIYLMLISLTINSNGILVEKVGEIERNFTLEFIQRECKFFSLSTIKKALSLLQKIKLIQKDDNGVLSIVDYKSLVGYDSTSAEYMKNRRAKQKDENKNKQVNNAVNNKVNNSVNNVNQEIRDIDIIDNRYIDNSLRSLSLKDVKSVKSVKSVKTAGETANPFFKNILTGFLIKNKYIDEDDIELPLYDEFFFQLQKKYEYGNIIKALKFFINQNFTKIVDRHNYLKSALVSSLEKDYSISMEDILKQGESLFEPVYYTKILIDEGFIDNANLDIPSFNALLTPLFDHTNSLEGREEVKRHLIDFVKSKKQGNKLMTLKDFLLQIYPTHYLEVTKND